MLINRKSIETVKKRILFKKIKKFSGKLYMTVPLTWRFDYLKLNVMLWGDLVTFVQFKNVKNAY